MPTVTEHIFIQSFLSLLMVLKKKDYLLLLTRGSFCGVRKYWIFQQSRVLML